MNTFYDKDINLFYVTELMCVNEIRYPWASCAFAAESLLITWYAITFSIFWYKLFRSNGLWTNKTRKAVFVKLLWMIFKLFCAWSGIFNQNEFKKIHKVDESIDWIKPGRNIWLHLSQREANCWLKHSPQYKRSSFEPNGFSTSGVLHVAQKKHFSCQCWSRYERS